LIIVQLGIVVGGLVLALVLLLFMCFIKRFKRWFELQHATLEEEEEDKPAEAAADKAAHPP
jgi:hypothetical protein